MCSSSGGGGVGKIDCYVWDRSQGNCVYVRYQCVREVTRVRRISFSFVCSPVSGSLALFFTLFLSQSYTEIPSRSYHAYCLNAEPVQSRSKHKQPSHCSTYCTHQYTTTMIYILLHTHTHICISNSNILLYLYTTIHNSLHIKTFISE